MAKAGSRRRWKCVIVESAIPGRRHRIGDDARRQRPSVLADNAGRKDYSPPTDVTRLRDGMSQEWAD
ncbi:hypothetical protein EVAR_60385_1 [Eumeta japonica]|uniref:Uncharacterized protein n=1 Tax=Eumeta variegata TaxID=151549 RepID=A0A4C2A7V0_EUMVA|nr:hypothetical protein EVAR_60385_1 [Eumeta japonica]